MYPIYRQALGPTSHRVPRQLQSHPAVGPVVWAAVVDLIDHLSALLYVLTIVGEDDGDKSQNFLVGCATLIQGVQELDREAHQ